MRRKNRKPAAPVVALGPPPRPVRLRPDRRWRHLWLCFATPPVVGLAVVLLGWLLLRVALLVLVALFGVETPGEVLTVNVSVKSSASTLVVRYPIGEEAHTVSLPVPHACARRHKAGDVVSVRALPWAPTWMPALSGCPAWVEWLVPVPFLFALFATVFAVGPVGMTWLRRWKHHALVRDGRFAPGVVVEKSYHRTRGGEVFSLRYQFCAGPEGVAQAEGSMWVEKDEYESVGQGDAVAVVYDPRKPARSIIYRSADYEVSVD